MIKIENTQVMGWETAIRGMRNPMNSWYLSDSRYCYMDSTVDHCADCEYVGKGCNDEGDMYKNFIIGPNDLDLMKRLRKGGGDDRKYLRMIVVYADITAPLYWWKEFDTYKIGTVANSCSTMHKITSKPFTREDFSMEHLINGNLEPYPEDSNMSTTFDYVSVMDNTIDALNNARDWYLDYKAKPTKNVEEKNNNLKKYWWQLIQLLPSSYNQTRTVLLNYEVLINMYYARKNHKLDEWKYGLCEWIKTLPYASELILGEEK